MPLVKAICKKCQNENEYDMLHWGDLDDKAWKKGWVNCPHISGVEVFGEEPQPLVKDDAPAYCRYATEQIVMSQEEMPLVKEKGKRQDATHC